MNKSKIDICRISDYKEVEFLTNQRIKPFMNAKISFGTLKTSVIEINEQVDMISALTNDLSDSLFLRSAFIFNKPCTTRFANFISKLF